MDVAGTGRLFREEATKLRIIDGRERERVCVRERGGEDEREDGREEGRERERRLQISGEREVKGKAKNQRRNNQKDECTRVLPFKSGECKYRLIPQ